MTELEDVRDAIRVLEVAWLRYDAWIVMFASYLV